jgi:DNA-binding NarL/FixJ family response regulator
MRPSILRPVPNRQRFLRDGVAAAVPLFGNVVRLDERRPLLTDHEMQVLGAIGRRDTTRGVAHRMGITPDEVESHKQRIFSKLAVQDESRALAVALRRGLLDPTVGLTGSAA